jgi:hypothetical protein
MDFLLDLNYVSPGPPAVGLEQKMIEILQFNETATIIISDEIAICKDKTKWHYKVVNEKQNAVNEYVCFNILRILGYRMPETKIVKNGKDYYCFSKFIENTENIDDNSEHEEYYWLSSLLPCIWGGFEPVERVFDNEGRPYIIDCSEIFMYPITKNNIYQAYSDLFDNKKSVQIFEKFVYSFMSKYQSIEKYLFTNSVYGFKKNFERIIMKIRKAKRIMDNVTIVFTALPSGRSAVK